MSDLLKQGDFTQRIQAVRDYDRGPRKLVIDLSNPVDELEFNIAGNLFYVLDSATSSDAIGVRFNEIHQPQFDFQRSQGLILDFDRVFITVPDGLTGNMEIMYGSGAPQLLYPLDGRTAAIDLLTDSRDYLNSIDGKFDSYLSHDIPLTSGIDWTEDDPVAGEISWTAGRLDFAGSSHDITAGSTANDFVYWDESNPTQFTGTDTLPDAIGPGKWIMAYNASGTPRPAFTNKVIHGGIIEAGTVDAAAINATALSAITANLGAITSGEITLTLGTDKLLRIDNNGIRASWDNGSTWHGIITVTGSEIGITADEIKAGTILADRIAAGTLSGMFVNTRPIGPPAFSKHFDDAGLTVDPLDSLGTVNSPGNGYQFSGGGVARGDSGDLYIEIRKNGSAVAGWDANAIAAGEAEHITLDADSGDYFEVLEDVVKDDAGHSFSADLRFDFLTPDTAAVQK